jgi:hypothetical protein
LLPFSFNLIPIHGTSSVLGYFASRSEDHRGRAWEIQQIADNGLQNHGLNPTCL